MFESLMKLLKRDEFDKYEGDIYQANVRTLKVLPLISIPISMTICLAQLLMREYTSFLMSVVILIYLIVLFSINKYTKFMYNRNILKLVYVLMLPVIFGTILMGTVLDPDSPCFTYLLIMFVVSVGILDRPRRLFEYMVLCSTVFLIISFGCKEFRYFRSDLLHTIEAIVIYCMAGLMVQDYRFLTINNLVRERYSADHDGLTGLKNRTCFQEEFYKFVNKDIVVMFCDLNKFKLFNDMYGHQRGDDILKMFASTLMEQFGDGSCYRYGGDEVVIIKSYKSVDDIVNKMKICQKTLNGYARSDDKLIPSCSCGFVYGIARSDSEMDQMLKLADNYVYKAKVNDDHLAYSAFDSKFIDNKVEGNSINSQKNLEFNNFKIEVDKFLVNNIVEEGNFIYLSVSLQNDDGVVNSELYRYSTDVLNNEFTNSFISFDGDGFVIFTPTDDIWTMIVNSWEKLLMYSVENVVNCKFGVYKYKPGDKCEKGCDESKRACLKIIDNKDKWIEYI